MVNMFQFINGLNVCMVNMFQFINGLNVCMVNMFLNGRPYLTVNWVEVWAVWRSKVQQNSLASFNTAV